MLLLRTCNAQLNRTSSTNNVGHLCERCKQQRWLFQRGYHLQFRSLIHRSLVGCRQSTSNSKLTAHPWLPNAQQATSLSPGGHHAPTHIVNHPPPGHRPPLGRGCLIFLHHHQLAILSQLQAPLPHQFTLVTNSDQKCHLQAGPLFSKLPTAYIVKHSAHQVQYCVFCV